MFISEMLVMRLSDNELRRLYRKASQAVNASGNDAEWAAFLNSIKELEEDDPWLRNQAFMTERLRDLVVSVVRKSARPIPDDLTEKVAKLVLLFEKPLIASTMLQVMLEHCNDPIDILEDAIRMAEAAMNAKFTRLTPHKIEEAIVDCLVEYSGGVGEHLEKPEARKFVKVMLERAQSLRSTGLKFEQLGDYASAGFVERLRIRGLMTRQPLWYRDSINFCLQRHTDPYLAAVTILRMAAREPDPTEGLNELLVSARGSI